MLPIIKCCRCKKELNGSPTVSLRNTSHGGTTTSCFCLECAEIIEKALKDKQGYAFIKNEFFDQDNYTPKSLSCEEGYFPPPWNPNENPEKTIGWLEFQKAMKNDPEYYSLKK